MIVLDASVLIPVLLDVRITSAGTRLSLEGFNEPEYGAPHLIDLEITHAFRRLVRAKQISEHAAAGSLTDLMDMKLSRFPHDLLLPRIWELRIRLSAYDAAYIALAEMLEVPLVTRDRAMAIEETTADVIVID